MSNLAVRADIFALERLMLNMPNIEIPVKNFCWNGMYFRAAFIQKGATVTGAIHRQDNLNIMASGDITVVTEDGENHFTGFNFIPALAGSKRAAQANEDTIWITILKTDLTDHEEIERLLVTNDEAELLKIKGD